MDIYITSLVKKYLYSKNIYILYFVNPIATVSPTLPTCRKCSMYYVWRYETVLYALIIINFIYLFIYNVAFGDQVLGKKLTV
jgi:hypothetical protein